ncbi:MAG TPA: WYL domain-containing protein, partial [Acidimicrobiales bacterium]|nr:WYL domain-containing protein [Acidimicrobiales bacterium]
NLAVAGVHLDDASGRDALSKLGLPGDYGAAQVASLPSLPQLPVLHQALAERAPVSFRYRSRPRTVDGYGLAFRGGFWYLVGRDHRSGEERTFRVDRMDTAVSKGKPGSYQIPPGYRLEEAIPHRPWALGEGEAVAAEVRVDPVLAGAVRAELGEQAVVDRGPDGSTTFRLEVTNEDAFVSWVLGLLDHAVVVSPEALRARLVDRLESLARGARG